MIKKWKLTIILFISLNIVLTMVFEPGQAQQNEVFSQLSLFYHHETSGDSISNVPINWDLWWAFNTGNKIDDSGASLQNPGVVVETNLQFTKFRPSNPVRINPTKFQWAFQGNLNEGEHLSLEAAVQNNSKREEPGFEAERGVFQLNRYGDTIIHTYFSFTLLRNLRGNEKIFIQIGELPRFNSPGQIILDLVTQYHVDGWTDEPENTVAQWRSNDRFRSGQRYNFEAEFKIIGGVPCGANYKPWINVLLEQCNYNRPVQAISLVLTATDPSTNTPIKATFYSTNAVQWESMSSVPTYNATFKEVLSSCDPPIHGKIMAFPTQERFTATDLNCDGDSLDTILQYKNLETGEIISTGQIVSAAHHNIDVYGDTIVYVGENSRIYTFSISTGKITGIRAFGKNPSIDGETISFVSDGTIHYYDVPTQKIVDTEIPGSDPSISGNFISFHRGYYDPRIYLYDIHENIATDTGLIGMHAQISGERIVFESPEKDCKEDLNSDGDTNDWIIRYFDHEKKILVNTQMVGRYPVQAGEWIVFTTSEESVNEDLNCDGFIRGNVIRCFNCNTFKTVNTQMVGTEPNIYGNIITYYFFEYWVGIDLTRDGDQSDPIVGTYEIGPMENEKNGLGLWIFFSLIIVAYLRYIPR